MGVCIAAALQTVCRRVRNSEIPMADPDDRSRHEGVSPDGRPRRQPPIIDVEAVEVSLDGSRTTTAGSGPPASPSGAMRSLKRILTLLAPMKVVIIGSVCVIAAIIGGALWIYLAPDGSDGLRRNAASLEAAVPKEVVERIAKPEADPRVGPLESRIAALDAMLAPLGDRVAALERAVRDTAAAARAAGERADRAAGLLAVRPPPRGAEGREGGDEQNRAQQNDRTAFEALANRVTALESRQTALQQKQEGLDRLATCRGPVARSRRKSPGIARALCGNRLTDANRTVPQPVDARAGVATPLSDVRPRPRLPRSPPGKRRQDVEYPAGAGRTGRRSGDGHEPHRVQDAAAGH